MDDYHPLLVPNFENASHLLPLLNGIGKCNYCGTWPMVIFDDPKQKGQFPTGHTSQCTGMLRGLTPEMDAEAVLVHLKERFGKVSKETIPAARRETKRTAANATS